MNDKYFPISKLAEIMLKFEQTKISLGYRFITVNKEIQNLDSSLSKLNNLIQDPKHYIFEQVSGIKRDVDLRKEKLKEKIDQICDEMIAKLDSYQNECYNNIENLRLKERNEEMIREIQAKLDEWNGENELLLMIPTDQQLNEIELKAKHFDINLIERLTHLKSDILMNKVWLHGTNQQVAEDFQRELVQFEGYFYF